MRKVAVLGVGQTKISEHWDKSLRDLAVQAIQAALQDANERGIEGLFVGNMLSGSLSQQENLATLIAEWSGLRPLEATKFESACSSGASAFRAGLITVASGELDSALIVGVEKMSDAKLLSTTSALATAADADYETAHGLSFVALNALLMRRYMHEYGWEHAAFAPFSITAHQNAGNNPFARLKDEISITDYTQARMVADPINLLDASPIGDGAAAVLLVPAEDFASMSSKPQVDVIASAASIDRIAIHDRSDPLWLSAAEKSAKKAYTQAGAAPDAVDIFELHDAFTIITALSLEACGFAKRGSGPRLGLIGEISLEGRIPISTAGGLKARGHPVGATGIYQIVEVTLQLRGDAGENQVDPARIGMAQNIGGSGATVITHILEKQ